MPGRGLGCRFLVLLLVGVMPTGGGPDRSSLGRPWEEAPPLPLSLWRGSVWRGLAAATVGLAFSVLLFVGMMFFVVGEDRGVVPDDGNPALLVVGVILMVVGGVGGLLCVHRVLTHRWVSRAGRREGLEHPGWLEGLGDLADGEPPPVPWQPTPPAVHREVTNSGTEMRSRAGGGDLVGLLPARARVLVLRGEGDFVKVSGPGGAMGWVRRSCLGRARGPSGRA